MGRRVAVMVSVVAFTVACGTTATSGSGPGGAVAPGTGSSAPTQGPAADRDLAQNALVTAAELGSGWSTKASGTTTTAPGSSKKPFVVDCPALAATHPALAKDTSATTATGPSFDRAAPPGQLTQVVVVMPTDDDAIGALAAFNDPHAGDCIKSLLGRQKGSRAGDSETTRRHEMGGACDGRRQRHLRPVRHHRRSNR